MSHENGYLRAQDRGSFRNIGSVYLSQGPAIVRVVVSDRKGDPFPEVPIVIPGIADGKTDEDGVLIAQVPHGTSEVTVSANLPEGEVRQVARLTPLGASIVHIRSVRKAPGPILTPMEIIAGGGGIGIFITGLATGLKPLQVLGEVLFIAAVFERVGRGL